jgi:phosphoribosylaminoimidazolecarboxamide formyltransferase/IMP cyclohydrolase
MRGDGGARHRRDRPGGGQPLPVRGDRGEGRRRDEIIENIDIGGPAMVRSAAKNHALSRSSPIPPTMPRAARAELDANGGATDARSFRRKLAAKAYARTAAYDSMISNWFAFADQGEKLPDTRFARRRQG